MPATPGPPTPTRARTRRSPTGRRTLAVVLGFLATSLVVTELVGDRGLTELLRARDQHRQLRAEVARARATNARLQAEVKRLSTDPAAIEELARRELGLIKPGEKLFIIRDVPASPAPVR